MKIMGEVVPFCVIQKWSEVTINKIMLNYEGVKNKWKQEMVIIDK